MLEDAPGNAQFPQSGVEGCQHRLQRLVLLTFTESLRINNELVFLIHRGHAVIVLDRALPGCHLGAFVVSQVALHFLAPLSPAYPWAVLKRGQGQRNTSQSYQVSRRLEACQLSDSIELRDY